jgi:hypothetical protein
VQPEVRSHLLYRSENVLDHLDGLALANGADANPVAGPQTLAIVGEVAKVIRNGPALQHGDDGRRVGTVLHHRAEQFPPSGFDGVVTLYGQSLMVGYCEAGLRQHDRLAHVVLADDAHRPRRAADP